MPFSKLDKAWSNLAGYYNSVTKDGVFAGKGNVTYTAKPEYPNIRYSLFDDGLIRGGAINVGIAVLRDTERIGKFFASGRGALFVAKQVGLQLSNPKLEQPAKSDDVKEIGKTLNDKFKAVGGQFTNDTRFYNLGLNTLAQIPLNAIGGHIIRHGLLPKSGVGFLKGSTDNINGYNYEKITRSNNNLSRQTANVVESKNSAPAQTNISNSKSSALNSLSSNISADTGTGKLKAIPTEGGNPVAQPGGSIFIDDNGNVKQPTIDNVVIGAKKKKPNVTESFEINDDDYVLSYNKAPNRLLQYLKVINTSQETTNKTEVVLGPVTLQDYWGGAESVYGIGKTFVKTYPEQRTNVSINATDPKYNDNTGLLNGFEPKPYSLIDQLSTKLSSNRRGTKDRNITYINPPITNNIEDRVGVSKIGGKTTKNPIKTLDSINMISITDSKTFYDNEIGLKENKSITDRKLLSDTKQDIIGGFFGKDIIKFRIEFLNNDKPVAATTTSDGNTALYANTDILAFRAYIDDFQDGMNAKWNPYRYMGRGEEFYVYDGFTRDISVAFTIFAHSPTEMKPIYRKLNYLMSSFAPDYSAYNKMRGNISYLTVGDYLYRQPGVFTDIKLSGMLDSHWEINLDNDQYELPKLIKVNLSFKPIHSFLPRKVQSGGYDDTSFITPDIKSYPGYTGKKNKYLTDPKSA